MFSIFTSDSSQCLGTEGRFGRMISTATAVETWVYGFWPVTLSQTRWPVTSRPVFNSGSNTKKIIEDVFRSENAQECIVSWLNTNRNHATSIPSPMPPASVPYCHIFWWRNGYGVGFAITQSWVRFPAGPLSSYLGQLSLPSLRGR